MNSRRETLTLTGLILALVIFVVGLTWVNQRFAAQDQGMNAFLPAWAGIRWYMAKAWSPYSQETMNGIEAMAYGEAAQAGQVPGIFTFPFYSILIFWPFALFKDFVMARALWMTLLELALLGILWLGIMVSGWRLRRWWLIFLLPFVLSWYPTVRSVLDGNSIVLCALFTALAFVAIRSGHDVLAGFLLALTTLKPEIMSLTILFASLWGISHRRWNLVWSLVSSLAFMILLTSILVPNWTVEYLRRMVLYYKGTFSMTPGGLISYWLPGIGKQLGWAFTIIMAVMLILEWRLAMRQEFRWFLWTAYLTLAASNLIGIRTSLENYVLLLPALMLVLATWDERWGRLGKLLMVLSLITLSFGLWGLSLNTVSKGIPPDLDAFLFLSVPVFIIIGLYWVRWWAIRPPLLYLETLSKQIS